MFRMYPRVGFPRFIACRLPTLLNSVQALQAYTMRFDTASISTSIQGAETFPIDCGESRYVRKPQAPTFLLFSLMQLTLLTPAGCPCMYIREIHNGCLCAHWLWYSDDLTNTNVLIGGLCCSRTWLAISPFHL